MGLHVGDHPARLPARPHAWIWCHGLAGLSVMPPAWEGKAWQKCGCVFPAREAVPFGNLLEASKAWKSASKGS